MFKKKDKTEQVTNSTTKQAEQERTLDTIVTPGQLVLQRFMRNKLSVIGIFILLFFLLFSFVGPFFMPYSEFEMSYHMQNSQRLYVVTADNHLLRIRLGDGLFDWDLVLDHKITGKPYVNRKDGFLYVDVEGGVVKIDTSISVANQVKPEFIANTTAEAEVDGQEYIWENTPKSGYSVEVDENNHLIEVKETSKGERRRILGGEDFVLEHENAWFINTEGSVYGYTKDGQVSEFRAGQRSRGWSVDLKELGYKRPYVFEPSVSSVRQIMSYSTPSSEHWLGTDKDGRDILTRLMYGGRISLMVGFIVVFIQIFLGVIFGGMAGFYGGWVDSLTMRMVDIFFCLPQLPLIMMINTSLTKTNVITPESGIYILMLILGILGWSGVARFVRGQILSLREQEYMIAAEATGLKVRHRIGRHLIPNVMPLLIVMATLGIGGTILFESALSFLGFGLQYPYASWGNMVNPVTDPIVMQRYLNVWIPPGVCILLTVLAFNFVGDGLRDALDPRMKR